MTESGVAQQDDLELAMMKPSILEHLGGLATAVAQLNNTWRPDDPEYRAGIYEQIMMNLSYAYFAYFHGDAEHPDWAPLWNPAFRDQPNPDDIYLYANIRGDLTYRVRGNRGTVRFLTINTISSAPGMSDAPPRNSAAHFLDCDDLGIRMDDQFEVIFSAHRPDGHVGHWAPISPEANGMIVRFRSVDWENEIDPTLSIECLDPVPLKPRRSPREILERIEEMAKFPGRLSKRFLKLQNDVKERVGINRFDHVVYDGGGVHGQVYWPAVFEFDDDEALIIETEMPESRTYWNIQINDPVFNAVEYVYRVSSLNEASARLSSDGRFRAVIALEDPGVPNWLDPAGFRQGTIYGRWYRCDSYPTPTIKRVKLSEIRKHLPTDTPMVTPEERAEQLHARVRACQKRRRW